jgi:glycosyltransferase involved in cell wall biosynthesis
VPDCRPLICIRPVTQIGGAEKSTVALVKEICKKRRVIVLDYYGCCDEYLELLRWSDIEYRVVMPEAKSKLIGGKNNLDRALRLVKAYKEMSVFITKLRRMLDDLNPETIWFSDDKSLYCVGRALERSESDTATVMFIRGDIGKIKWICKGYWKKLYCIVGNNSISMRYYEDFPWARGKLRIAYNGLDLVDVRNASLQPARDIPAQDSLFKIILPAMLIPLKAQDMAIRGFAEFAKKVDSSVLWLCGNTPNDLPMDYENSLKSLVKDLGLETKVFFLGWRKDVPALIKMADVMILTSTTEGLPRSILEAMAIGTPVVSTKAGGVVEAITDGVDGMLIEIGDHGALADKLFSLTNQLVRDKITCNAVQTIERRFTIARQASAFLEYIGVTK